jgi:hypothetical protein
MQIAESFAAYTHSASERAKPEAVNVRERRTLCLLRFYQRIRSDVSVPCNEVWLPTQQLAVRIYFSEIIANARAVCMEPQDSDF